MKTIFFVIYIFKVKIMRIQIVILQRIRYTYEKRRSGEGFPDIGALRKDSGDGKRNSL